MKTTRCRGDSINAATLREVRWDLTPFGPELLKRHDERIAQDPEFQYIMKDIARGITR